MTANSSSVLPEPAGAKDVLTIRPLAGRVGLSLAGEADAISRDALRSALAALAAEGVGEIHLEMAGLRFIDVSCTRELVALVQRHPSVRTVLHDPPALLLRIVGLTWPEVSFRVSKDRTDA